MKPGYPAAAPGSVAADPYRRCSMRRRRRGTHRAPDRACSAEPGRERDGGERANTRVQGGRRPGAGAEEEKGTNAFLASKMRLTPFPSGIVGTILELLFLLGLARRLSDLINSGYRPGLVDDYDY